MENKYDTLKKVFDEYGKKYGLNLEEYLGAHPIMNDSEWSGANIIVDIKLNKEQIEQYKSLRLNKGDLEPITETNSSFRKTIQIGNDMEGSFEIFFLWNDEIEMGVYLSEETVKSIYEENGFNQECARENNKNEETDEVKKAREDIKMILHRLVDEVLFDEVDNCLLTIISTKGVNADHKNSERPKGGEEI